MQDSTGGSQNSVQNLGKLCCICTSVKKLPVIYLFVADLETHASIRIYATDLQVHLYGSYWITDE